MENIRTDIFILTLKERMNDLSSCLRTFVHKTENIPALLRLLSCRKSFEFAALFCKRYNTVYDLLGHVSTIGVDLELGASTQEVMFSPYQHVTSVLAANGPSECKTIWYYAPYTVRNVIIIPLYVGADVAGIVCAGNAPDRVHEDDVSAFEDVLGILQMIISKAQLMGEFKKVYADSTYFSKDLFLANISHEIRTPLNGIIGYNQLLAETKLTDLQRSYVASMTQCSVQLLQLINDVIDFSKLSSGKMQVTHECVSLDAVMITVQETLKSRFKSHHQTFTYHVDPNVPELVIIDRQKLTQIIINLVSNAHHYSGHGTAITVRVTNHDRTLRVSVQDNGVGISDQDQCKLFNSFVQLKHTISRKGGTGLGLAITKRLVELLGGAITVDSSLGKGATFTFTCRHESVQAFEQKLTGQCAGLKGRYALIIEEHVENRMAIMNALCAVNMRPVTCGTVKEGLTILENSDFTFDVAIINVGLYDSNGNMVADRVKELQPFLNIIGVSERNTLVNFSSIDAYVDLPIMRLQLFNTLHTTLQQPTDATNYLGASDEKTPSDSTPTPDKASAKILVADDVGYNRSLLDNMLRQLGYSDISLARDGQETIEMVDTAFDHKVPFDILLLDLRMPKVDGYEVIEHIRHKGYPLPTIIAVTASVLPEDRHKCKESGVEWFITKPIDLSKLKRVLLRCINK